MVKVIPMQEEHIEGVLAVEEATFSIPWTRKDFEREVRENAMAIYFVAIDDSLDEEKVVGYAGMWHVITEGHITNVAVLHEYRRQGIGDLLMENLEKVALEREMIGITLEVRINNEAAQRLYHKYGFRPEGIRKNYYADTREDAVIMWKYYPFYEGYEEHCNKG
ncbi:ribosomal protein S18-alanine N-acetyltransferase [Anaerotignum sp. MB30-C6]|uniref:ribosomal protein S18-alanine N-acetyltransferase n=1 Tax=Anaerotignum sp. MB30-C6 TaxID=3070814 RepID=UPI0027DBF7D9|nr:ribosomal protein S18-alanine N-acetyltransferase [Anaerotignum sp. MB30-C6]WMI80799.1 ribosomal protein S18-alanine N-acetyltransferase [Anaerotignum sp. MB30-C6]